MKSIQVHIPALLEKLQEMLNSDMTCVTLSINDEVVDQDIRYPAFLHFEAAGQDGSVIDFESIDAFNDIDN